MDQRNIGVKQAFLMQIASAVLPALIVVLTIPQVRQLLTPQDFGAYTLVLTVTALLAGLDGGLSRASTYFVGTALRIQSASHQEATFTAVILVCLKFSGWATAVLLLGLYFWQGDSVAIARPALLLMIAGLPLFVLSNVLRGYLEAERRFLLSTRLQLIHGVVVGSAPVILFEFSKNILYLAGIIVLLRSLYVVVMAYCISSPQTLLQQLWRQTAVDTRPIVYYTQWLFLSNVVGLSIVYADRFFAAGYLPSIVAATYIISMDTVSRLQILVSAFSSAAFPRLLQLPQDGARDYVSILINVQGLVLCGALLLAIQSCFYGKAIFAWWLGSDAAPLATDVFTFGILGVGLIGCAALSVLHLNSRGITKPIAISHFAQLPCYLLIVFIAARSASAAALLVAWLIRLVVDAFVMTAIVHRTQAADRATHTHALPPGKTNKWAWTCWLFSVTLLLLSSYLEISDGTYRFEIFLLSMLSASAALVVFFKSIQEYR
jgi:O-antigen/teichoic acid export membrane protein